ncbi:hypothetical protein MKP07_30030 [Niabella hibiscisoli]|nr:hypothetical protein [Niabella hibiscisoli]MCH5720157.1 hypothetical protein [Niabella hibiscisoli]
MLKTKLLLALLGVSISAFSQDISLALQKAPKFTEAQRVQKWKAMPGNVVVSFASSGTRFTKDLPSVVIINNTWEASGWRNEKLHTQIVTSAKIDLGSITVKASDLKSSKGEVLKKENISTGFVQYVMTDEFRNGCGYRKPADFDSSMVADMINTELSAVDVQKIRLNPFGSPSIYPKHSRQVSIPEQ